MSSSIRIAIVAVALAALGTAGAAHAYDGQAPYGQAGVTCNRWAHDVQMTPYVGASPRFTGQWIRYRYFLRNVATGAGAWTAYTTIWHQRVRTLWPGVTEIKPLVGLEAPQVWYQLPVGSHQVYAEYGWYEAGRWYTRGAWTQSYDNGFGVAVDPVCRG
jgi:hypothetical protein